MKTLEKEKLRETIQKLYELDENGRALINSGIQLLIARQQMEEQEKGGEEK